MMTCMSRTPLGNRPGQSASTKYEELARAWRRQARSKFLLVGSAFLAIAVAVNVLSGVSHHWRSYAGFVTGALAGVFVTLVSSPPAWIEHWQDGAWGEERTGKVLEQLLDEGWQVVHDLPAKYGNLDHVVVGPGGIFLLDSKRWHGSVSIAGDVATIQRIEDSDLSYRYEKASHLRGQAAEVNERVRLKTRATFWVSPVVVIWGDFPEKIVEGRCSSCMEIRSSDGVVPSPWRATPCLPVSIGAHQALQNYFV